MDENLSELARNIEKDLGIKLEVLEQIQQGHSNQVYKGRLTDGNEVFIKINYDRAVFPKEIRVYEKLREIGIPVPEVLGYAENPELIHDSVMILSKAPGIPLNDPSLSTEERTDLYMKAAKILRRIHDIKFKTLGRLELMDGQLMGMNKSWEDVWRNHLHIEKEIKYLTDHNLITLQEKKVIEDTLNSVEKVKIKEPALLHADFHGVHIFTEGGEISGIIDPGSAFSGDPRYDIAIALFFMRDEFKNPFTESYGDIAKDPLVEKYILLIAAYKSAWRHRKGMESAEKAFKVLRELINNSIL